MARLQAIFRADSASKMGIGHIMRCATLAQQLRLNLDAQVTFICRTFDGNLTDWLGQQGYQVLPLPVQQQPQLADNADYTSWLGARENEDADETLAAIARLDPEHRDIRLLITDHYGIGLQWQQQVHGEVDLLVTIDELLNRPLDCDLLVDTTLSRQSTDYDTLLPANSTALAGSQYALLRPDFSRSRQQILDCRQKNDRGSLNLLVMMGGTDPSNLTLQACQALEGLEHISATVVVGATMAHWQAVRAYCREQGHTFLHSPENVAALMLDADIAIAAAGTTAWERCASGLPSLMVIQAENQRFQADAIAATGAARVLDLPLSAATIQSHINHWRTDENSYMDAVSACLDICDGSGASKVVTAIRSKLGDLLAEQHRPNAHE